MQHHPPLQSPAIAVPLSEQHIERRSQRKIALIYLLYEQCDVLFERASPEFVDEVLAQDRGRYVGDVVVVDFVDVAIRGDSGSCYLDAVDGGRRLLVLRRRSGRKVGFEDRVLKATGLRLSLALRTACWRAVGGGL